MMVDEEFTDVNFEQEPDNSMDMGSEDFHHLVLYRGIDGLGPFRPKVSARVFMYNRSFYLVPKTQVDST